MIEHIIALPINESPKSVMRNFFREDIPDLAFNLEEREEELITRIKVP